MPNLIKYFRDNSYSISRTISKEYSDDGTFYSEIEIIQNLEEEQKQVIKNLFIGTAYVEFS